MAINDGVYKTIIVGGGPGGIGVFIRAARTGYLPRLLDPETHGTAKDNELTTRLGMTQKGVAILHAGDAKTFGSGNLGEYINNSNTFACSLVASVLDERPELDPPESIKNTFLENARAHESAKCLSGIGTATANLTKIGSFLNYVGACIIKEIEDNASDTSKCLLSTAATKFEALENGLIRVEAKSTDGSGETTVFHTEHLVLAMGGVQELPSLDNQAYHSKLFTADACLREDGFMKLKEHLLAQPVGERKVCIVGGSHSSFSVAWLLLTKFADVKGAAKAQSLITLDSSANPASVEDQTKFTEGSEATPVVPPSAPIAPVAPSTSMSPLIVTKCETPSVKVKRASVTKATIEPPVSGSTIFKPKDIIILHRSPIRCYYATKKEAEADGVDGSRADRAGCVNTFTGLREDAKKLFKNVIAGRELRIRLLQVKQNGSQAIIDKAYATASAIVWGAGYKTNVLPGFDEAGKSLEFLQDSGVIKLDNKARLQLLGDRQGKSPSVLGVGLGYSLRSSVDEMGSETRVDGVTIYHRRGASLVLEALLGPEVYGTSTSFEEMVEKNEKKRRNILAAKAEKAEKVRIAAEAESGIVSPLKTHIPRSGSAISALSPVKIKPMVNATSASQTSSPTPIRRSPSKTGSSASPIDKKMTKRKDISLAATNPPVKMLLSRRRNSVDGITTATTNAVPPPSLSKPTSLSSTGLQPENAAAEGGQRAN